jgi:hypothetical protein
MMAEAPKITYPKTDHQHMRKVKLGEEALCMLQGTAQLLKICQPVILS